MANSHTPWDRLQPQDVMSRHRGAKQPRRYGLLGGLSACYPQRTFYPLSDGPSTEPPDHYDLTFVTCSTCQSRSQAGLCHCTQRAIPTGRSPPSRASVTLLGGDRPSQTAYHARSPAPDNGPVRHPRTNQGGISTCRLHETSVPASQAPTYPTQPSKCQCKVTVKVHGSFRLAAGNPASSQNSFC